MNETIKNEWVAALRSGEYKQGRNYLRKDDSFCCLGVLCEVAIKNGVELDFKEYPTKTHKGHTTYTYNGTRNLLPWDVADWAGIDNDCGEIRWNNVRTSLSEMNDNGMTFERIADVIEEKL